MQGHPQAASCQPLLGGPTLPAVGGAGAGGDWVGAPVLSNSLEELLRSLADQDPHGPSPWMPGGASTTWTSGLEVAAGLQALDGVACAAAHDGALLPALLPAPALAPAAPGGAKGSQAAPQQSGAWQWMGSWPVGPSELTPAARNGLAGPAGAMGACLGLSGSGGFPAGKGAAGQTSLAGDALGAGDTWAGFPLWHDCM